MKVKRKTKIICTLGPVTESKEAVKKLALSGMDVARLNFSHGDFRRHQKSCRIVREVSQELGNPMGILEDLEGYKIRTGTLRENHILPLEESDSLTLFSESNPGKGKGVTVSYPELHRIVKPKDKIFIDDGKIELEVLQSYPGKVETKVILGGLLGERKGVQIPGAKLEFPPLTQKDARDIFLGIELKVDYLAQSFVRQSQDILLIKDILKKKGASSIGVIAKIEDSKGVENIDEIIKVSDGIMIARGDMGVCLPRAEVPLIQKMIIGKCNQAGKPVITATQMLDSMIHNKKPTRAEVADVANAIIDGTDLLMLSGETAVGSYPEQTVKEMHQIAMTTEASLRYDKLLHQRGIFPPATVPDSLAFTARELAQLNKASVIIAMTRSGDTAKMVSKYRPAARIIAVTPDDSVAKTLLLYWGVETIVVGKRPISERHPRQFLQQMVRRDIIARGELVVVISEIKRDLDKPSGSIRIFSV